MTRRSMRTRVGRSVVLAIGVIAVTLLGGCRSEPIAIYQQRLESFVIEEHNGDLGAIRIASDDADRFDVLWVGGGGIPLITMTRTDAHGVILDARELAGELWYFLIVGIVHYTGHYEQLPLDDSSINDIRIVAVTADRGTKLAWLVGENDKAALASYRAAQRGEDSKASTGFPTDGDHWTIEFAGGVVRVTERTSGGVWTLPIPGALAATRESQRIP